MAEFLTTTGISDRLEKIIKGAEKRLLIISPYVKVNKRIREFLEETHRQGLEVYIICRKKDLKPKEKEMLESLAWIGIGFREDLHAKCYLNENEALLTSMNLHEFSARNNDEMGVVVSREEDHKLYNAIREEADRILRLSEEFHTPTAEVEATDSSRGRSGPKKTPRNAAPTLPTPKIGFCIQCREALLTDPTRPYCKSCYTTVWNQYKIETYKANYCHTCGDKHVATLLKPVCRVCYKKYKDVLKFAVA